ncbi:hypothetical protein CsSME_00017571 [Camellia sinensis var. sinensis]
MDAFAIHLAMAALVGASFVAVSAYYMHRKTLSQLLEFAKAVERQREDGEEELGRDDSPEHFKKYVEKRRSHGGRRKGNGYYRCVSASRPDVVAISGYVVDGVEVGLPRLQTLPEGKPAGHVGSTKRTGHLLKPTSPKSPVASASAFESVEESDDEDNMTDNAKLNTYIHTNGNAGPGCNSMFQDVPNNNNANGEQIAIAASSMIRTHSVSGDLHGVQPDPVAADILRKEPEHEIFVRLNLSPNGICFCFLPLVYVILLCTHSLNTL